MWMTSEPEWISEGPVRFLGVEISKMKNENSGWEDWRISQASYIQQLLKNEAEEVKRRKIPVSRELVAKMSEDEEEVGVTEVRAAQKVVGELLWVVTRSRPDLMFVVSKMGARVTKSPRMVVKLVIKFEDTFFTPSTRDCVQEEGANITFADERLHRRLLFTGG